MARVSTGKSLIVHIVAHARMPDGKVVMVMNNWLPVWRVAHCGSLARFLPHSGVHCDAV